MGMIIGPIFLITYVLGFILVLIPFVIFMSKNRYKLKSVSFMITFTTLFLSVRFVFDSIFNHVFKYVMNDGDILGFIVSSFFFGAVTMLGIVITFAITHDLTKTVKYHKAINVLLVLIMAGVILNDYMKTVAPALDYNNTKWGQIEGTKTPGYKVMTSFSYKEISNSCKTL